MTWKLARQGGIRGRLLAVFMLLSFGIVCTPKYLTQESQSASATFAKPTKDTYLKLADEMEMMLRKDVLGVWFPRTVDEKNGGFYSDFTREWQPSQSEGKFSVFQGRMTWIAAQIVMRRPDLKEKFLPIVRHGLRYLRDVMWDKEYGGFYWGLDDAGRVTPRFTDGKHLYGMSFCLYGAAAAYQATHDPAALELARKAFGWIDEHAHDNRNGGYFEWLTREGKVVEASRNRDGQVQGVPVAGFPVGYKSMNTHLHLLESLTQLYEVWKDASLRQRLEELLSIIRDRITVEPGAMNLYFTNDWRAIPGHDSYGHDVETAYLMQEATDVLGRSRDRQTARVGRLLVDHALAYGWDETYGGFYHEGTAIDRAEDMHKEWWAQVEGLNALLLMHEKYGRETDRYFRDFQLQWAFIRDRLVDHEFGGLFDTVERDGKPTSYIKARIWKAAYHDGRALLNVSERLRRLAGASSP
jgi:mannose/cellobiose epimerase-like protein (N-acyl-D-glucosamine 2-epimerase family)